MNMFTAAIILAGFLANAFFMFCACRAASFSDRQDEALFKK